VRTCKLASRQVETSQKPLPLFPATSHGTGYAALTGLPTGPSLLDHENAHHNTEPRHEALLVTNLANENTDLRAEGNLLEDPTLWGNDGIIEDWPNWWALGDVGLGIVSASAAMGAFGAAAVRATGVGALGVVAGSLNLLGSAYISRKRRLRQDEASPNEKRSDSSKDKV